MRRSFRRARAAAIAFGLAGVSLVAAWCAAAVAPAPKPAGAGHSASSTSKAAPVEPADAFLEQYAATLRFSLGQPSGIKVTPDGDAVLFLRSPPRSFVRDLWELDVETGKERVWLTADQVLQRAAEQLPPEERARRERQRMATRGIPSFHLSEDGRRILVPLAGRLFVVERMTGVLRELKGSAGFPIDPQLSPDGSKVAFVRNGDLYVIDVASGAERRLTEGANDTLSHGAAEFAAQEEMDRFSGYWWSPDSRSLAYQETRTGQVEEFHILDPGHPEQEPDAWRYPRAGTANADVRLGVISAEGGPTTWARWDHARYPYLASVRWTKNAPLTLLVQNRRQTEEALLAAEPKTGAVRTLLVERDKAWINLDSTMPKWLEDGSGFLWTTERGGSWQLELRGRDGRLDRALTPASFGLKRFVSVDDAGREVWVTGSDDPTQTQLFRIPLDRRGAAPEPVTREPGVHGAVLSRNHRVWVHTIGSPERAPTYTVTNESGAPIAELRSVAETPTITPRVEFVAVGPRAFHAAIVRPTAFRPKVKYPVILDVYGGPGIINVTRSRSGYLIDQWIADHGFIVVSLDGRGTPGRGHQWERSILGDLGTIPLEDQVEGLKALAAKVPEMDLGRTGVYGWSFGGYLAALAVMRHPEMFRAGVAGAPVADWRDYDTHYTERYMDLPDRNPKGYEAASVLTYADRLASPLLILHGTADDNVYFLHSMKLTDALFRAGKRFEFVPLARFTHMVPDPLVTQRLYQRIATFFEEHLAARTGPAAERRAAPAGATGGAARR